MFSAKTESLDDANPVSVCQTGVGPKQVDDGCEHQPVGSTRCRLFPVQANRSLLTFLGRTISIDRSLNERTAPPLPRSAPTHRFTALSTRPCQESTLCPSSRPKV